MDVLSTQAADRFDYTVKSPPVYTVDARMERRPVIVGGRYNKFSRYLPQTRFTDSRATKDADNDDDDDATPSAYTSPTSVSELIAKSLVDMTGADSFRFV